MRITKISELRRQGNDIVWLIVDEDNEFCTASLRPDITIFQIAEAIEKMNIEELTYLPAHLDRYFYGLR